ncbi:MAG: hypothetical protein ABFS56_29390 [Pseudomonadota bacterium]
MKTNEIGRIRIHPDILTEEELAELRTPEARLMAVKNVEKTRDFQIESYRQYLIAQGLPNNKVRKELLEMFEELREPEKNPSLSETVAPPEILEAEKRGEVRGSIKMLMDLFLKHAISIDIAKQQLNAKTNDEVVEIFRKISPDFNFSAHS